MNKVKIILDKNQTPKEAEELLFKALESQRTGEIHDESEFLDPAMTSLENRLMELNKIFIDELIREVLDELEEENDYI